MTALLYVVVEPGRAAHWSMVLTRLALPGHLGLDLSRTLHEVDQRGDVGAIVVDLPGVARDEVLALLDQLGQRRPDVPIVLALDAGDTELARAALQKGVRGLIDGAGDLDGLAPVLRRVLNEPRRVRRLPLVPAAHVLAELLGSSDAMQRVRDQVLRLAGSHVTVLITGESGTGKELVARALHATSPREAGPLEAVNCGAIPESLIENELFGHVRGAYTDATRPQPGLFVRAAGGTVLLDEIGELPLHLQPKLLRALQERRVRPVGGDVEVDIDVRLLAATHRNLAADVDSGRFRGDLLYRVDVVRLHVPSLRERGDDVRQLAEHFLRKAAERSGRAELVLSPPALRTLCEYTWPGNVRQLENCIERAVAVATGPEIGVAELPPQVRSREARLARGTGEASVLSLEEAEKRHIARVLAACEGNKSKAAHVLGIARRSLYRRLETFET